MSISKIAIVAVFVLSIAIAFIFLWPNSIDVTISQFRWERAITIEIYKTVSESGWHVPQEGRITTSYRRLRYYDRFCAGIDTKGNCTYLYIPVYDTWFVYDIERWVFNRQPTSKELNHYPYWPDLALQNNERESGRYEKYSVVFNDKDKREYEYVCSYEEWKTLEERGTYRIQVNTVGSIIKFEKSL